MNKHFIDKDQCKINWDYEGKTITGTLINWEGRQIDTVKIICRDLNDFELLGEFYETLDGAAEAAFDRFRVARVIDNAMWRRRDRLCNNFPYV